MRSIVEEKFVAPASLRAMLSKLAQDSGIGPFVCNHDIRVSQHRVEIESLGVVKTTSQLRVGCMKCLHHAFTGLLPQVMEAPPVTGLEDLNRVPER